MLPDSARQVKMVSAKSRPNRLVIHIVIYYNNYSDTLEDSSRVKGKGEPKMPQQFNVRLPEMTHNQIAQITEAHGLTKTQVIILAVDRLSRALIAQDESADKDARRLKTVARIAPDFDLGQEE